ncbi:MAG TPA: hypothetical protein VFZ21_10865 [Gemmatimonadaceae bacterium]|jgi:hypothetical protein|nr:hypothetical protein [Gemmatimonadaceae bacterium]
MVSRRACTAGLGTTAGALLLVACLGTSGVAGPTLLGDGTRVLFVGNSLTYVNDVPGILQALADSAGGERLAVASRALPNYALIDHWTEGVVQGEIAKGGWAWVVMQQGWTPAGVYRDTLRLATRNFGAEIAKIGATPALYQTWPPSNRRGDFPGSIESYELAAADVSGVLFPVARAWLAAWERDPTLQLYSDGLHASPAGSYLAALVMYARIFQRSPVGLPARLRTRSGMPLALDASVARTLQEAAASVTLGAEGSR